MNIDTMTEREMDVAVHTNIFNKTVYQAEYTGYRVVIGGEIDTKYELYTSEDWGWTELPNYTANLDATYEMEEELQRRNLMHHYIVELAHECDADMSVATFDMLWKLTHATPIQRVKAALRVVMKDGII
jgi:hypothetical protein